MSSLGKVRSFEDLEVWKAADKLARNIFQITRRFPRAYLNDLSIQLRRAALSIPSNIAEGSASLHSKELIQSLNVARRSLSETRYLLLFAREEGLIQPALYQDVAQSCESIGRMLNSLMRSLNSSRRRSPSHD